VLEIARWIGDRLFGMRDRRRAFDAEAIDQTVRRLDAITAGFVAILEGKRPKDPTAVDATYADAGSIGADAVVLRLTMLFAQLEGMGRSGQLAALPTEQRLLLRTRLIEAMEDVRAAAVKRRRSM
jgi:hypothetical protein